MDEVNKLANEIRDEFASYKSDVEAKIGGLTDTVASLQAQIDSLPPSVDTTQLQADLDAIKAAHAALNPQS